MCFIGLRFWGDESKVYMERTSMRMEQGAAVKPRHTVIAGEKRQDLSRKEGTDQAKSIVIPISCTTQDSPFFPA